MKKYLVIQVSKYGSMDIEGSFDDERKAAIFAELSNQKGNDDHYTYHVAEIKETVVRF